MRVTVTGASGFVGQAIVAELLSRQHVVNAVVRLQNRQTSKLFRVIETIVKDIGPGTDWSAAVASADCVVHCAARTHVMKETEADAVSAYRVVNVDGTRKLAEQAADAGVKRFVYLSSIKVNGEQTISEAGFTSKDHVYPEGAYGITKWEAEQALHEISSRTGLEVVIIRPPLIYGPGVKGNFLSMLRWLNRGLPLPLGAIHNQRSLIGLDNLIDMIVTCIEHPAAADQTFLVSDDEDLFTTELLRRIGNALGKPARLLPIPSSLLQFGANLVGKQDVAQRLLGNLQVDISHTKQILGWTPPFSVDEELRKTADWYLSQR